MNLQEYQNKLKEYTENMVLGVMEGVVVSAHNLMLGAIIARIEIDGQMTSGAKIGSYSKKEAWYDRDRLIQQSKFTNRSKVKGKKTKKTMYFADGYYGLRKMQGREVGFVNLAYTRDTISNLRSNVDLVNKRASLGFGNERSAKIAGGHKKKYGGNIYVPGKKEMALFEEEMLEGTKEIIKEILR